MEREISARCAEARTGDGRLSRTTGLAASPDGAAERLSQISRDLPGRVVCLMGMVAGLEERCHPGPPSIHAAVSK